MAYPVTRFSMTFRDYDKEQSNLSLWGTTLTAANFDAQNTAANALSSAIQAISIGRLAKHALIAYDTKDSALPAATKPAQREDKWILRYHDTSSRNYSVEVPCADSQFLATNSEFFDTTVQAWTDLKTAFEAYVKSPGDSSAVTLDSAQHVGRRS